MIMKLVSCNLIIVAYHYPLDKLIILPILVLLTILNKNIFLFDLNYPLC